MASENVKDYIGQHSITFVVNGVSKNTWSDWGLVPSSRHSEPTNPIWSQKTSIAGVNGEEDLVRAFPYNAVNSYYRLNTAVAGDNRPTILAVYGYDIYQAAAGSLSFIIADQETSFFAVEQQVANFLHNRVGSMVFSDDPGKSYYCRFEVDSFTSSEKYSSLGISYTVLTES